MVNYELKYGVAEVAKILEIEKQMIKKMAYHFKEYLNYYSKQDSTSKLENN